MKFLIFLSCLSFAEVSAFNFSGKVISFDKKMVVVETVGRRFTVKREDVAPEKFRSGDMVQVTLRGSDIKIPAEKSP